MNHRGTPPIPQRGNRSRSSVPARSGWAQEHRWLNVRLSRKLAVGRTTKVCTAATGPRGQRCGPEGFQIGKRLFRLGGAGADAKLERWRGEAWQYREAWARMPRWFAALVAILAHALPGRVRDISQESSWSASSLPPLLRGAAVA